jgi:mannose-1-phosphate guanylyltransferase
MILAAGEGTRLRPLTLSRPKPIVPVAGRPLLSYTLDLVKRLGAREVAINVFWRPDEIIEELGDGSQHDLEIHYSREPQILGTAGGVKRMASLFDDDFLVLYGDTFYDIEIDNLVDLHRREQADATIGVFTADDPSRCGIVEVERGGRVTGFVEKPAKGTERSTAANAGVYILSPGILEAIPEGTFCDFGRDVFPELVDAGAGIFADYVEGYLSDTGTFDLYKRVNFQVAGSAAEPIVGASCVIDHSARVGRSVLWDGCVVAPDAVIDDSILADGCRVGRGAHVLGSVLGDSVEIAEGAGVAGSVVWPGRRVEEGKSLENCTLGER